MTINDETIDLIKSFEGLRLKAYQCSAGKWTVGYGSTFYEDGRKVKKGDIITIDRANKLFYNTLSIFVDQVSAAIKVDLSPNKFGALVSLAYNIGINNFISSTLLKKVNANPNDENIRYQFSRWCLVKGVKTEGLVKRRKAEANLYFKTS